jgi:hypothetical protein
MCDAAMGSQHIYPTQEAQPPRSENEIVAPSTCTSSLTSMLTETFLCIDAVGSRPTLDLTPTQMPLPLRFLAKLFSDRLYFLRAIRTRRQLEARLQITRRSVSN